MSDSQPARDFREAIALWLAPWLRDERERIEELERAYRWAQAGLDATRDV
jgi:hypothetical protein